MDFKERLTEPFKSKLFYILSGIWAASTYLFLTLFLPSPWGQGPPRYGIPSIGVRETIYPVHGNPIEIYIIPILLGILLIYIPHLVGTYLYKKSIETDK
jgi:hypothetical protein